MACDNPITIKFDPPVPDGKGGVMWSFPADCGKCLKCLIKRKAQWSYRMTEEQRNSFSSCMVTLTYNNENVSFGEKGHCINKNDHFEFIKSLKELESKKELSKREMVSMEEITRKANGTRETGKLKYYGVSEYGDTTFRPHWHYILFNVRDFNNIALSWGRGKVQLDECNVNTIDYVLKYMLKESSNTHKDLHQKEVSFMSKGIGVSLADKEFINYIGRKDANFVLNTRGTKIPLPRYFRKKFLTEDQRQAKAVYISEAIRDKEVCERKNYEDQGRNYDLSKVQAIEQRQHLLKNRQKRNVE